MTAETLPVPMDATEALVGEVITPEEVLHKHEVYIRKNWKKALGGVESIARSLNVIYWNELWKLHTTTEGKRQYTNWNDYLTGEFGWDKTPARARQIMNNDLPLAIEAGEVPETSGATKRQRSAPEIDVLKAATVSHKQIAKVAEALENRIGNVVDSEELLAEWTAIAGEVTGHLNAALELLENLSTSIIDSESDADDADADDADDEDEADEDES